MMNTIKQGLITILVSFAVFFFMPVVTFASSVPSDYELNIDPISFDDIEPKGDINYTTYRENSSGVVSVYRTGNLYRNNLGDRACGVIFNYTIAGNPVKYICRVTYNGSSVFFCWGNVNYNNSSPVREALFLSRVEYSDSIGKYWWATINSCNIPIFESNITGSSLRDFQLTASQYVDEPFYDYLVNGVLRDTENVEGYGYQPGVSATGLGYIKPSYYLDNHVGSSGSYEIITWASTSTTGVDLTDSRYNVQFALRDKSYTMSAGEKAMINFDTYPNFVEGTAVYLGRNIYNFTHDNVNNAILQGKAVPMSTYNNMVSLGITSASSRRFAFNAMNEYSNSPNFQAAHPEIAANLNNVINANIQEFIPGGFLQRVFNDSNLRNLADFQLSYDIYARISDSQTGIKGNWLLIDKHGRPVKDLGNVLNGGSTIRPVKVPDFEPTSDFTTAPDDEDIPDEELDDNDTVKDEPLPTGYIDPSSGDGVTNYYNYTYNYDNRTWIENHYDNQTVEEVNEGFEWIKMFPGFFGLFLKFFGAFLPGWAVVCVTIAIPIIIGLLIFKAIKGVIPFV